MLAHLGDMAEVKGWALSMGRINLLIRGQHLFLYV
jgi:hypothetical protein